AGRFPLSPPPMATSLSAPAPSRQSCFEAPFAAPPQHPPPPHRSSLASSLELGNSCRVIADWAGNCGCCVPDFHGDLSVATITSPMDFHRLHSRRPSEILHDNWGAHLVSNFHSEGSFIRTENNSPSRFVSMTLIASSLAKESDNSPCEMPA